MNDMNLGERMQRIFGKVAPGMCKISMTGAIAVKTSTGYKSYNVKTGRLTNCNSFAFDIGEDFFFVIPTNKVVKGDIILIAGKPKCVISADKNRIEVMNYEDSTIETVVPERHVFMGDTYFYGKIVSMFGDTFNCGKKGKNNIMKFMMMSEVMKSMSGGSTGSNNGLSAMLPLMMMSGGMGNFDNMFSGIFDSDDSDDEDDVNDDTVEESGDEKYGI